MKTKSTTDSWKEALALKVGPVSGKIAHTIPQAIDFSGLSRSVIYEALKEGKLHARKAGRRTLIEDAELRRFIGSLPVMGGSQ